MNKLEAKLFHASQLYTQLVSDFHDIMISLNYMKESTNTYRLFTVDLNGSDVGVNLRRIDHKVRISLFGLRVLGCESTTDLFEQDFDPESFLETEGVRRKLAGMLMPFIKKHRRNGDPRGYRLYLIDNVGISQHPRVEGLLGKLRFETVRGEHILSDRCKVQFIIRHVPFMQPQTFYRFVDVSLVGITHKCDLTRNTIQRMFEEA